jgi:hypothetical protein
VSGVNVFGISFQNMAMRIGYVRIAGIMDGKMVHFVKPVKKFSEKLPAIRMFVGLEETRTAEAVFAAMNSLKIHAFGCSWVWWVK